MRNQLSASEAARKRPAVLPSTFPLCRIPHAMPCARSSCFSSPLCSGSWADLAASGGPGMAYAGAAVAHPMQPQRAAAAVPAAGIELCRILQLSSPGARARTSCGTGWPPRWAASCLRSASGPGATDPPGCGLSRGVWRSPRALCAPQGFEYPNSARCRMRNPPVRGVRDKWGPGELGCV